MACLLATANVAIAAPRRHAALHTCLPGQRGLLTADTQAQLYALHAEPESTQVFGCAYGHRLAYKLGIAAGCWDSKYMEEFCGGVDGEVLAGPIVAYEETLDSPGCGFCRWAVIVRDLRTGRLLRNEPTGTPANPASERFGVGATTTIVVKSDGSVAWIANAGQPEGGYQLHAVDTTGSRLLATGSDIYPASLALAASTLYWTQGGKPFSAPLN